MIIEDILSQKIVPFEIDDEKLKRLFSFFLHLAPTIESASSLSVPSCGLNTVWEGFLRNRGIQRGDYHIYSPGHLSDTQLEKYKLMNTDEVKRNSSRFVGCFKDGETDELSCVLRHLRNSLAHSNVSAVLNNKRKYIIFDDYNGQKNHTARLLFSQTDLNELKKKLTSK